MTDRSSNPPAKIAGSGLTRRSALKVLAGSGAALIFGAVPDVFPAAALRSRRIPATGETLPAIGLGTWRTFDVPAAQAVNGPLAEVLRLFVNAGGRLVDSSPMYGRSEEVVGKLAEALGVSGALFRATKVWTRGREAGNRQGENSRRLMGGRRIDLMQVHNLVDWRTHLPALRERKAAGRIRFLGVTDYRLSAFDELAHLIRRERLDFVQLPYSVATRGAEKRLLPMAADHGTAVIVNRPFEEGQLFRTVRGKALPPWAEEFDCASWAQFFLKFILANPAVTCVIPATSKPKHLRDNMAAGRGRSPDPSHLKRMAALADGW